MATIAMLHAADNTAWFGTPVPPAVSDPRKPVMRYDDVFAPLPVQFAHRRRKFDELLDAAALKADQKKIVQSGTFYHSSGDVLESVPAEGLERAARFHAFFIEQADQAAESPITSGEGTPYQSVLKGCQ